MFLKNLCSTDHTIPCSQPCGLGHYRMRGFYSIRTQAGHERWLADEALALSQP